MIGLFQKSVPFVVNTFLSIPRITYHSFSSMVNLARYFPNSSFKEPTFGFLIPLCLFSIPSLFTLYDTGYHKQQQDHHQQKATLQTLGLFGFLLDFLGPFFIPFGTMNLDSISMWKKKHMHRRKPDDIHQNINSGYLQILGLEGIFLLILPILKSCTSGPSWLPLIKCLISA